MKQHETHLYTLWRKQRRLRVQLVIVLVVCVTLFLWLKPHIFQTKTPSAHPAQSTSEAMPSEITKESPDFVALTPSGKTVEWNRLAPPNSASFYVYTDTINGISVRVSEQPLPSNLQSADQMAELAKNYNANRSITVDTATVYIGTSLKGQQSVIFTKRSLLVLITSNATLNDEQWSQYISSMQ